MIMVLE